MLRPGAWWTIQALGAAGLFGVLVAVGIVWNGSGGSPVEMFDWGSFEKQQASLSNSVDAAIMKKGRDVVQQLHELKDMVRPRWARRRTVPMDEELAMLKIHKQMRTEAHFPKDRISGAGDVTGIVNEEDTRMEHSALMEPAPGQAVTKTSTLFENCRDSSLTVEDAELCQRRANAIKMLTRNAVAAQLAESPPVSPRQRARRMANYAADKARQQLVADALVGREFLAGKFNSRVSSDSVTAKVRRALSGAKNKLNALHQRQPFSYVSDSARREQLVNTYSDYLPSGDKVICTCDTQAAGDEEMEGLSKSVKPACMCKGGSLTKVTKTEQGGPLDTGSEGAWPQGLSPQTSKIDGTGADAYKARRQELVSSVNVKSAASDAHSHGVKTAAKQQHVSGEVAPATTVNSRAKQARSATTTPINPVKHAVAKQTQFSQAAPAAKHARKASTSAHGKQQAEQTHAASPAVAPTQHLKESSAMHKAKTHHHVSQLALIKQAVDAAGTEQESKDASVDGDDKKLLSLEKDITQTENKLADRKRAFRRELEKRQVTLMHDFEKEMREIQDGIQLTTGATVPLGKTQTSAESLIGAAQSAILQDQASQLQGQSADVGAGQVSPAVAATRAADFGDVARAESAVSVGGGLARSIGVVGTPNGEPASDTIVKEIMQRVKESRLYQHPPRPLAQGGHKVPATLREKDVLRHALEQQFEQVAGQDQHPLVSGADATAFAFPTRVGGEAVGGGGKIAAPSGKIIQQGLRMVGSSSGKAVHVGPASYKALSNQASRYMQEAINGKPTLNLAAQDALAADAHNKGEKGAEAELHDAEKVLCTVEALEAGGCSGNKGDGKREEKKKHVKVPQVPSVATIAADLAHNIGEFFGSGGMMH